MKVFQSQKFAASYRLFLTSSMKIYLDTNAFFKYFRDEPGSLVVRRLISDNEIYVSAFTCLEFVGVLAQNVRMKKLKKTMMRRIVKRMRYEIGSSNSHKTFTVLETPQAAFREAQSILLQHGITRTIGSGDALHIGIVVRHRDMNLTIVTSDQGFKHVCSAMAIPVFDPEKDSL